jgi:hypothetical protein
MIRITVMHSISNAPGSHPNACQSLHPKEDQILASEAISTRLRDGWYPLEDVDDATRPVYSKTTSMLLLCLIPGRHGGAELPSAER